MENINLNIPGVELVGYGEGIIHIYIKNPEDSSVKPVNLGSTICELLSQLRFYNPMIVETLSQISSAQPDQEEFILVFRNL